MIERSYFSEGIKIWVFSSLRKEKFPPVKIIAGETPRTIDGLTAGLTPRRPRTAFAYAGHGMIFITKDNLHEFGYGIIFTPSWIGALPDPYSYILENQRFTLFEVS